MVDASGEIRDWWTPADLAAWDAIGARVAAQYSGYTYPGVENARVNGTLTQDGNMADLAGLLMALDAYKIHLAGRPAPVIDGYTGEQRVFLGWAQFWRTKYRPKAVRRRLRIRAVLMTTCRRR